MGFIFQDLLPALAVLGAAALFGGFFHQWDEKAKDVTKGMFLGGLVFFVAKALVLVYWTTKDAVDYADTHTIVNILIAVAIAVLVWMFRKGKNTNVWWALGILSTLALVLGFFW